MSIGDQYQSYDNVDTSVSADTYKFVTETGGEVAGTHEFNSQSGSLFIQYTELADVTSAREYFLETCVDNELRVYQMIDEVISNTAPYYEDEIEATVTIIGQESYTF